MHSPRPIYLTNTLGHRLEEFAPLSPPVVRLYSCGPTVYSYVHIGNLRAYLFADTLRRMLEYNGYRVRHVRNVTDVGHLTDETLNQGLDRIEAAARTEGMTPWDIARHYTEVFEQDAERLNLERPDFEPRATEYIEPMIRLIERLMERGFAYESAGDVYYDVSKFPLYGALSGNTVDELVAGARVEVGEGKKNPADFALWKAAGPDRIMRWPSPWGEGVPGWHIECSAMSMCLLGEELDIHTGGVDNIFPHHEDEIAQSEAATERRFVRYWMHNAWLQFGEEKMSKSLGNIYTITDLAERGMHPLSYRYFTFQAHYRTPLSFTWGALEAAQTALYRLWESAADLLQSSDLEELDSRAQPYRERFQTSINRDLDTPGAVAVLHEVVGSSLPGGQKLALLADFDQVLGLDLLSTAQQLGRVSQEEQDMLAHRAAARKQKDWERSDALRAQLMESGLEVKDTPRGQSWVRKDRLPRHRGEA